ncbi:UNVERIFIED_CONTAM: hypothetical protein K2H54_025654 [Gekko kuhli]
MQNLVLNRVILMLLACYPSVENMHCSHMSAERRNMLGAKIAKRCCHLALPFISGLLHVLHIIYLVWRKKHKTIMLMMMMFASCMHIMKLQLVASPDAWKLQQKMCIRCDCHVTIYKGVACFSLHINAFCRCGM